MALNTGWATGHVDRMPCRTDATVSCFSSLRTQGGMASADHRALGLPPCDLLQRQDRARLHKHMMQGRDNAFYFWLFYTHDLDPVPGPEPTV